MTHHVRPQPPRRGTSIAPSHGTRAAAACTKERDMVGKPNFPDDVDARGDLRGSAAGTPGLTALDEEREASLADEGGASGATIESQDVETLRRLSADLPVSHLQG